MSCNAGLGAGGGGQLEELVMAEQQKALVQSVIARLTEMAFETCITKPASSLSSGEQSCIQVQGEKSGARGRISPRWRERMHCL